MNALKFQHIMYLYVCIYIYVCVCFSLHTKYIDLLIYLNLFMYIYLRYREHTVLYGFGQTTKNHAKKKAF